jgi:hypothetical protein
MNRRTEKTPQHDALWVLEYVDRMNPSGSFDSEPMPYEQAKRQYDNLTSSGITKTVEDKDALSYYGLRQMQAGQS